MLVCRSRGRVILASLGISDCRSQISYLRFEICDLRSRKAGSRPERRAPESVNHPDQRALARLCPSIYIRLMKLRDESVFVGELTTTGRRTGLARTVELRMVYLAGKFFAASSSVQNKHWCRNMLKNPDVMVKAAGELFPCQARQVEDETLRRRVLNLRDAPPLLERVVFEMKPSTDPG
jgi:deazaflavin-dependent oxidoreductase (nitroreductase family)